jgi:hypothetical protein
MSLMSLMRKCRFAAGFACAVILTAPVAAYAQQGGPPMPKPGPEHDIFKMDVGTWDAAVAVSTAPGEKPMTSKGVEVNTLGCGGLCLISDFKGEMMPGTPFHGHGVATWDALKKVYRGSWTDSMSVGLMVAESKWDPATKKMTGMMEGPDMSGKVTKMRAVVDYATPGKRVFTLHSPGPDGKEAQAMQITYTLRK